MSITMPSAVFFGRYQDRKNSIERPEITRCGIIPVTASFRDVFMYLGRHIHQGRWSDFGGGRKKTETTWQAATRELQEEALGCFDAFIASSFDLTSLQPPDDTFVLYTKRCVLFFVPLIRRCPFDQVTEHFRKGVLTHPDPEMTAVGRLKWDSLRFMALKQDFTPLLNAIFRKTHFEKLKHELMNSYFSVL